MIRQSINIIVSVIITFSFCAFDFDDVLISSLEENQQIEAYLNTARNFKLTNIDSSTLYALKAVNISENENLPDEFTESSILLSECYEAKNDIEKSIDVLEKGIEYNRGKSDENQVKLMLKLGDIEFKTGDYAAALLNYNKAIEINSKIDDPLKQGEILNNIGIVYKLKGEYSEALNYHLNALRTYEKNEFKPGIAESLGNIGNVNESLSDYEKALENYSKALVIFRELKDEKQIANSLMNIGVIYFQTGRRDEALKNFLDAYDISSRIGDSITESYSLNNIAYVYDDLGNYKEAINYYKKAYRTADNSGNKWGMANTLNNMASVYNAIKNYNSALQSVNSALEIAQKIEAKDLVMESYKVISDIYESQGKYDKALEYHKLYKTANDSIFAFENQRKIADANVKYETEKKENEISELKIGRQDRIIIFAAVVVVLISIIALINFALYRQKKKSSEYLKNVIDSLTHPFIVYDVFSGKNELLNKAAKNSDSPYFKFIKSSGDNFAPFTKKKIIEKRESCSVEYEEESGSKVMYFEFYGFPIFNKKMNVAKIIEYAVNTTENKEAINRIKTAFERERELNELKSNFISSTSHEFRTPLATLFSSVELIQHYDKTNSSDKKEYHLGRIKDIVVYMTKMLDNILTINKADVNKIEFEPEIINLKMFCREILEDIVISASDKHLIDQVFEGGDKSVFVDPNLVRHILTNLLSNAIKYSPDGGKILFKTEVLDNSVRFTVRDEGIGIPKEDIDNLYQYFYRARNSKTISGTGLGLSIVKKSIEVHKGTIELTSREGEGTTFVVTLPTNKNLVKATFSNKNRLITADEKDSSY